MLIRHVVRARAEWTLWNVVPTSAARLAASGMEAAYREGWLAFDSGAEKRQHAVAAEPHHR